MSDTELAASAAQLYYIDERGQSEIASILGVSRPKVSRLLALARESGIVRISVSPYEPRNLALERQLRERFDLHLAVVVKAFNSSPESARRAVGYYAAPVIAERIKPGMTIGVAGGRTLGDLVHCVAQTGQHEGIRVLQLMGHIDPTARNMDAPELARTLADRIGGAYSTLAAPAFVSDAATRTSLLAQPTIERIFRDFESLDMALVGIGIMRDSIFAERGVLDPWHYAQLETLGAVGEICGHFFDADGRECASDYRERVMSIGLEQLRQLPEVAAVTFGANRSAAIRAAIRGDLISSLIIDDAGAAALLKGLEEHHRSRPSGA